MTDEATALQAPRLRHRVRLGLRKGDNWKQLLRFAAVGGSGYVVNLATFAICVHPLAIDYRLAAVISFLFAVASNFWWNRHWTFVDAKGGHAGFQAVRFLAVSAATFALSFVVLTVLVDSAGLPEVLAQAIAIVIGTPLSFVGNKLWSFGR